MVSGPTSMRKPHYITSTCTIRRAVLSLTLLCYVSDTHHHDYKRSENAKIHHYFEQIFQSHMKNVADGSHQLLYEPSRKTWELLENLKAVTLAAFGTQGDMLQGRLRELQDIMEPSTGGSCYLEMKPDQPSLLLTSFSVEQIHHFMVFGSIKKEITIKGTQPYLME